MAKQPAQFLQPYNLILFDMDGVITSEQRYWDASALAICQLLWPEKARASGWTERVADIRSRVFCGDKTISLLKERGVNSNWDLTYVVYAVARMLGTDGKFETVYDYLKSTSYNALELYEFLGTHSPAGVRGGGEYERGVALFQEWYLGDSLYRSIYQKEPSIPGKPGLLQGEEPILPVPQLQTILRTLQQSGITLGIGTGRVTYEIEGPLSQWDIGRYFDPNRLITYSHIQRAEAALPGSTLTKPHPYMFVKGMLGEAFDDKSIVDGNYNREACFKTLVVGDAGADLLSAQAAGLDFAAVLTGVSGQKARSYFEQQHATYILNSIADLIEEV